MLIDYKVDFFGYIKYLQLLNYNIYYGSRTIILFSVSFLLTKRLFLFRSLTGS